MIGLLKPGKTTVNAIPVGATYGFNSRSVDLNETDLPSISRAHLEISKSKIQAALPKTTDKLTTYHLQDMLVRIKMALDPK